MARLPEAGSLCQYQQAEVRSPRPDQGNPQRATIMRSKRQAHLRKAGQPGGAKQCQGVRAELFQFLAPGVFEQCNGW